MSHILFSTFLYEPMIGGGAAAVPYRIIHEVLKFGYKISVLTSSPNKHLIHDCIDGVDIYRIPTNNVFWINDKDKNSPLSKTIFQLIDTWNPFVYHRAKTIIKNLCPDVIHVHKLRGLSPSIWNAAHVCGIPIIQTSHDYELISPQGTLNGRIGQMAVNQSWLLRPYQGIRRKASKSVKVFTAPSLGLLKTHLDLGFFSEAVHQIIPNSHGYNREQLAIFEQIWSDFKPGAPFRILFLGRLHTEKGIKSLLSAFLTAFEVNHQLILDIAGDGPELAELMSRYEEHAAINFHGHVSGEQKEKLISGCDILVFPSIVKEGLGIAIIEALAHGKPVIATRCGGPEEILKEGVTGFFVDPGDITGLKEKILVVCENREKLSVMRLACHKTAKKYCIEDNVESYLSIYQRLLNG